MPLIGVAHALRPLVGGTCQRLREIHLFPDETIMCGRFEAPGGQQTRGERLDDLLDLRHMHHLPRGASLCHVHHNTRLDRHHANHENAHLLWLEEAGAGGALTASPRWSTMK